MILNFKKTNTFLLKNEKSYYFKVFYCLII